MRSSITLFELYAAFAEEAWHEELRSMCIDAMGDNTKKVGITRFLARRPNARSLLTKLRASRQKIHPVVFSRFSKAVAKEYGREAAFDACVWCAGSRKKALDPRVARIVKGEVLSILSVKA